MERFLRLFYNNGSFFTFCLLQIVCLFLIVNRNSPQSAIALETWSVRTGKFKSAASNINEYVNLHEQEDIDKREIAKLRSLLPYSRYNTVQEIETFLDSTSAQRYKYLATRIVNRTPYGPNNTFVIDRGSDLGVAPGQGVVDDNGLLGIVDRVTDRHARVVSILHGAARVSAGLENGYFGTLRWEGDDPRRALVTDIPDHVRVAENDTLYTTGFSNVFPTHQVIGTVEQAIVAPGTGNQSLVIKLSNSPLQARSAYVVQDLFKEELSELEN